MRFFHKQLAAGLCLSFATLQLCAQGYIVPSGVTYAGTYHLPGFSISVVRDPTNGVTTGFSLDPFAKEPTSNSFTNSFIFDPIVDVGVRVFFASRNQAITTNALLSGPMTELKPSSSSGYIFQDNVPFYLALYTGNMNYAPPSGVYNDPLLGWVQLVNNQGAIQMLGGALEYKGAGIYAGTQNIINVPEPGSAGLLVAGGLLGAWGWRRRLAANYATHSRKIRGALR